jgi:hypothetical protein
MLKSDSMSSNNGIADFVVVQNWAEELKRLVPVE